MPRPQLYPKADSKTQWFQDDYPGSSMDANVGVLHTTEGTDWPSYNGGSIAPNLTAKPDFKAQKLVYRQHFPVDKSSRALVNRPGGVETNTLNAFQIELVGTCDPDTHARWAKAGYTHLYWPEAPDWALRDLAALFAWLAKEHGIPLTSAVKFLAYPSSYGSKNGQRLSGAAWLKYTGWLGHQHVPESDHGDPGGFPIGKVLSLAKALVGKTNPPASGTEAPKSAIVSLDPQVKPGARHWQVKELQQLLIKAGYGPIQGAPTDFYGPETQRSVARFHDRNPQYSSGLHDPKIGPQGFIALQKQAGRR